MVRVHYPVLHDLPIVCEFYVLQSSLKIAHKLFQFQNVPERALDLLTYMYWCGYTYMYSCMYSHKSAVSFVPCSILSFLRHYLCGVCRQTKSDKILIYKLINFFRIFRCIVFGQTPFFFNVYIVLTSTCIGFNFTHFVRIAKIIDATLQSNIRVRMWIVIGYTVLRYRTIIVAVPVCIFV